MNCVGIACLNQPKQEQRSDSEHTGEPVAWRAPNWSHSADDYVYRDFDDPVIGADGKPSPNNEPLYTTPQQRPSRSDMTWVGLTDQELEPLCKEWRILFGGCTQEFAHAIEAKLKEKNGY